MGTRRQARESTLQILFQREFDDTSLEQALSQYWEGKKSNKSVKEYSQLLVDGVLSHQAAIDSIIQSASEHWRISRMALVDRNILRIAVFELFYEKDLAPAIVINEAIEIAKKYSGGQSAMFINGVLDAISKNIHNFEKSLKDRENGE